jgi:hypothetical protein
LSYGIVHSLAKLLLDLSQLGLHAFADRRSPYRETPQPILPADMREA